MKKNQAGIALLMEMVVVLIITVALMAMSAPSFVGMMRGQNQVAAHKRVNLVAQAQAEVAICSVNNTCSAAAVAPLVPPPGSMTMGGYVFTMSQAGTDWSYTADPQNNQVGIYSYWVDQTGVVRCDTQPASASSPVCR